LAGQRHSTQCYPLVPPSFQFWQDIALVQDTAEPGIVAANINPFWALLKAGIPNDEAGKIVKQRERERRLQSPWQTVASHDSLAVRNKNSLGLGNGLNRMNTVTRFKKANSAYLDLAQR